VNVLDLLKKRTQHNWLVGQDAQAFLTLTETLAQEFATAKKTNQGRAILLAEPDPIRFLAGFLAAHSTYPQVFLGNPQWGMVEWQQALAIAQPDQIWGNCAKPQSAAQSIDLGETPSSPNPSNYPDNLILIPTGGSSGTIRFVMHRWDTMAAAAYGLQHYFQIATVNSLCVLPLYHVSGLMQFMRSFLSGGKLQVMTFKALKTGQALPVNPSDWFISLVPTQLQALLTQSALPQWLRQCKAIFLGGAPSWPQLLDQARAKRLPLAPCYGSTETAAQITTLKPTDFLAGNQSVGQLLPHAQVTIADDQGQSVAAGTLGQVQIVAESLALGYYPHGWSGQWGEQPSTERLTSPTVFKTDDAGYLDDQGYLTLVGRLRNKIITGGENVFPAEVEAAIRATGLVTDVAVLGMPDSYWGQCVTAIYVPHTPTLVAEDICAALQDTIARFKRPKLWVPVENLPRNAQGKLNQQILQTTVNQWKQNHGL
jgi:O-succinylbenzoic acid--CoA ligase